LDQRLNQASQQQ